MAAPDFSNMGDERVRVTVSKALYEEIDKRIKSKALEFDSVDAFVEFALSDILDIPHGKEMSPDDEETVSKRLGAFGY